MEANIKIQTSLLSSLTPEEIAIVIRLQNQTPMDPPFVRRVINKMCNICSGNVTQNHHDICLPCIAKLTRPIS